MFSKDLIIERGVHREDRAEYDDLLNDLIADLKPVGRMQEVLVERVAVIIWRLRRCNRWEKLLLENEAVTLPGYGNPDEMNAAELTELTNISTSLPTLYRKKVQRRIARIALAELAESRILSTTAPLMTTLDSKFVKLSEEVALVTSTKSRADDARSATAGSLHELQSNLNRLVSDLDSEISAEAIPEADISLRLDARVLLGNRYETTLEKQLYRALMELRIQQRAGRPDAANLPIPAALAGQSP